MMQFYKCTVWPWLECSKCFQLPYFKTIGAEIGNTQRGNHQKHIIASVLNTI